MALIAFSHAFPARQYPSYVELGASFGGLFDKHLPELEKE
jgi:hypothetical protein